MTLNITGATVCSVMLHREGATAGVDVRGCGPVTRELTYRKVKIWFKRTIQSL